jgi:predicted aldo/keto reductase-like oxidoreductase
MTENKSAGPTAGQVLEDKEDDVESTSYLSPLAQYRLLGASGLRVSPMCLGTMTFGTNWKNTTGEVTRDEVEKIFDYYVSQGGNFIDASNRYHDGQTEQWIGEMIEERGIRDDVRSGLLRLV